MSYALAAFRSAMAGQFGQNVATDAPADLEDRLPFHRIQRAAGSEFAYPYDEAVIEVDTFAADEDAAYTAAEAVRQWVRLTLPGTTQAGMYVNGTDTTLAPVWTPWDDTNVRRVTARYRITLH